MLYVRQLYLTSIVQYAYVCTVACTLYRCGVILCDLTPCCLCLVRFDYCRFIELDYVPMETGYMVSMRPTKGYTSTKSPTKGYASTKSPDRHSRSTNSPSTPRSRSVLSPSSFLPISVDSLKHGNDETLCTVVNVSWKTSERIVSITSCVVWPVTPFFFSLCLFSFLFLILFSESYPYFISFEECFLQWHHWVSNLFWFLVWFSSLQHTFPFKKKKTWNITVSAQRSVCPCLVYRQNCCLLAVTLASVFVMCLCIFVRFCVVLAC